jgi:PLD-like domain
MPDRDEPRESPELPEPPRSARPPGSSPPDSFAGHGAPSRSRGLFKLTVLLLLFSWLSVVFWNSAKPLPPGMHVVSQTSRLSEADVDFLAERAQQPEGLTADLSVIDHADQLIVVDRSPVGGVAARHLLARRHARPNLKIVVVTDPGSELLGGTPPLSLASLEQAGVIVARVRLDRLRDSNPLYTGAWRMVFGWWSDPFEETPEQSSLAAWSRDRNSKADQRQILIADDGAGGWAAVVSPADARTGLVLRGALARAMVTSELQVAAWSTDDDRLPAAPPMSSRGVGSIDARFLTEGGIETALLDALTAAGGGDSISVAVDTLSDRPFILAALRAATRGAHLQVLLSPHAIPNRIVAHELRRDGNGRIDVRWSAFESGSTHPKLLLVRHRNDLWVNWGSANFTRRNLADLNLETAVELRMPVRSAPARAATDYFANAWASAAATAIGPDSAERADESSTAYWRYRFAEATGLSSF